MEQLCPSERQVRGWFSISALAALCSCLAFLRAVLSPDAIDPEPLRPKAAGVAQPAASSIAPPAALPQSLAEPADQPTAAETLFAVPTPLSEEQVAAHIAVAWQAVVGSPIQRETLAVLWAHSALETGRGRKMLGYNFAGLKGEAPTGGGRLLWTWEESSQGLQRVRRTFRVYSSAEQGAHDYVQLLSIRHRRAWRAAERGSPTDFVAALAESDYFTHDVGEYTRAVTSLMFEHLKKNPKPRSGSAI